MISVKPDPLLGQQFGNYVLEQLLGSGALGSVYLARHHLLGSYVAVKVIEAEFEDDPAHAKHVKREARSLLELKHPHIVRFFEFGIVGNLYYLAVEHVDGVDLARALANYARYNELIALEDATRIVERIAGALDYVHSQGVIHRDVKPSNILLDKGGRPVLTDFGLARILSEDTEGSFLGSAHYMAPEQVISSANAVPQSDLYALGVVLYQMLTGALPFDGDTPMSIALKHINEPPPAPRSVYRDLHPALEQVILRALSKEVESRYQSGAALVAALHGALEEVARAPQADDERAVTPPEGNGGPVPVARRHSADRPSISSRSLLQVVGQKQAEPKSSVAEQVRRPERPAISVRRPPAGILAGGALLLVVLCVVAAAALLRGVLKPAASQAPDVTPSVLESATAVVAESVPPPTPVPPTATPAAPQVAPQNAPQDALPNVEMVYDDTAVTLINVSGAPMSLAGVIFECVSDDGSHSCAFSASEWDRFAYYPISALPAGDCYQVVRHGKPRSKPPACDAVQGWVSLSDRGQIFWMEGQRNFAFRIVQNGEAVHSCPVDAGQCAFYLPQP